MLPSSSYSSLCEQSVLPSPSQCTVVNILEIFAHHENSCHAKKLFSTKFYILGLFYEIFSL